MVKRKKNNSSIDKQIREQGGGAIYIPRTGETIKWVGNQSPIKVANIIQSGEDIVSVEIPPSHKSINEDIVSVKIPPLHKSINENKINKVSEPVYQKNGIVKVKDNKLRIVSPDKTITKINIPESTNPEFNKTIEKIITITSTPMSPRQKEELAKTIPATLNNPDITEDERKTIIKIVDTIFDPEKNKFTTPRSKNKPIPPLSSGVETNPPTAITPRLGEYKSAGLKKRSGDSEVDKRIGYLIKIATELDLSSDEDILEYENIIRIILEVDNSFSSNQKSLLLETLKNNDIFHEDFFDAYFGEYIDE
jgi:hypothetical protein